MKWAICLFTLIWGLNVSAQMPEDIFDFHEEATQTIEVIFNNPPLRSCQHDEISLGVRSGPHNSRENTANPFHRCLTRICGRARSTNNTAQNLENEIMAQRPTNADLQEERELREKIRRSIEQTNQRKIRELQNLRRVIADENFRSFSPNGNFYFMLTQAINNIPREFLYNQENLIFSNQDHYVKSRVANNRQAINNYLSEQMGLQGPRLELMVEAMVAIINNPHFQTLEFSRYISTSQALADIYPGQSYPAITQEIRREMLLNLERASEVFPMPREMQDSWLASSLFRNMDNPNFISEATLRNLFNQHSQLAMLSQITNQETLQSLRENLSNIQFTNEERLLYLQKIDIEINNLSSYGQRMSDKIERTINHCISAYTRSKMAMPTQRQTDIFLTKIARLKEKIAENFRASYSEHTSVGFIQALMNLPIMTPPRKENMLQHFEAIMNSNPLLDWAPVATYPNQSAEVESALNANTLSQLIQYDEKDLLESIDQICGEQPISESLNDTSSLLPNGGIMVSWSTIRGGERGIAVVAHEIGHFVQGYFANNAASMHSFGQYQNQRLCLSREQIDQAHLTTAYARTQGNQNDRSHTTHQWNESIYTSENFADFIGAMASTDNLGCFLLTMNHGRYEDNTLYYPANTDNESHSPDLQRVLRIHQQQNGTLPRACQRALREQNLNLNSGNCARIQ